MDCCRAAVDWMIAGNCCQRRTLKVGCCMAVVAAGASRVEAVGSPGWKEGWREGCCTVEEGWASPGRTEGCRKGCCMEAESPCRTDGAQLTCTSSVLNVRPDPAAAAWREGCLPGALHCRPALLP